MRSKKLYNNVFSTMVLHIVVIVYGFILPKVIIGTYGSSVNGLVSSITQFLGYIALLESGFGPVVKSVLYKPIAENDLFTVKRILKSSENFFRKIAFVFVIYVAILCFVYPFLVKDSFDFLYTFSLILIISVSIFAEYYFGMTYKLFLQAKQKVYIISIIQLITYLISIVIILILAYISVPIHVIKLCSGLVFIFRPILQNLYVKKKYNIYLDNVSDDYEIKQKWDGLSQHIAYTIHTNTDVAVLTLFSKLSEVSVYSVYLLVVNGIKQFIQVFTSGVDALFGEMIAKKEKENFKNKFNLYESVYFTIVSIVFTCTIILIVPFISIYTKGNNDVNYIRPLFGMLLAIGEYVWALRLPYSTLISTTGRFKETRVGAWVEAISNIVLSVILVIKYGIVGVAIGTIVSLLIRTIELVYHTNKYILNNSMWSSFYKIFVVVIETSVACVIFNYFVTLNYSSYLSWMKNAFIVLITVTLLFIVMNFIFYGRKYLNVLKGIKKFVFKKNKIGLKIRRKLKYKFIKLVMPLLCLMPKDMAHRVLYRLRAGKRLDLNNPKTLNEKIHYMIVNHYGEKEAKYTDKVIVKSIIEKMNINDLYIPKTIAVYNKDSCDVESDKLPDCFVLKCNHGSGHVFICKNKSKFNLNKNLKILKKDLNKDYSKGALEYHYSFIEPKIMVEEYLADSDNSVPADYKFFCYNGDPKCVMVCTERGKNYKATFFDKKWVKLNYSTHPSSKEILKPKNFEKMWKIAGEISKNFKFVRVDLYNLNGKIYFGELTFSPAAGFSDTYTKEADRVLGDYLEL